MDNELNKERGEFLFSFLNIFMAIDLWVGGSKSSLDPYFGDINHEAIGYDKVGKQVIDRLWFLTKNYHSSGKIDRYLILNPNETIQLIEMAILRGMVSYKRLIRLNNPSRTEQELIGVMKFTFVDFFNYYGTCKKEIEELFTPKQIQEITESRTPKKAKTVWNLRTRFELLELSGFIDNLRRGISKRNEQNFILSQVLGCSEDNAKKLLNGSYQGEINEDENLEFKSYETKLKQMKQKGV